MTVRLRSIPIGGDANLRDRRAATPAAVATGQGETDDAMQRHTLTPSLPPLQPQGGPSERTQPYGPESPNKSSLAAAYRP